MFKNLKLVIAGALFFPLPALAADLSLQPDDSVVSFITIKKDDVAETHTFNTVSGMISDSGAMVTIDPASVNTGVSIRDDRMKAALFDVEKYTSITIKADVTDAMSDLQAGQPKMVDVPATLALHGVEKEVSLKALVSKNADDSVSVSSVQPVLVRAEDYGLTDGVKKLAEMVGDIEIADAVPVSFVLSFK